MPKPKETKFKKILIGAVATRLFEIRNKQLVVPNMNNEQWAELGYNKESTFIRSMNLWGFARILKNTDTTCTKWTNDMWDGIDPTFSSLVRQKFGVRKSDDRRLSIYKRKRCDDSDDEQITKKPKLLGWNDTLEREFNDLFVQNMKLDTIVRLEMTFGSFDDDYRRQLLL